MSETVRSVERAIEILSCFSIEKPRLTVAEISNITGLNKSTAFRLLASLESKGMVEKITNTHQYKLGIKILELGNVVQSSIELRSIAFPVMKRLSEAVKETVNINIIQGNHRVCIEKIDGTQLLRKVSEVGKLLPLHKGASGKLLLAFCPQDKIISVLKENKDTLTEDELNKLKIELFDIRDQGFATSDNERLDGTSSISAAVRDYTGNVVGGLTISGPSVRFSQEKINFFIEEVLKASEKISSELGYNKDKVNKSISSK